LIADLRKLIKYMMIKYMAISSVLPGPIRSPQAADWALAHGVVSMTTLEVAELLGAPPSQVPQRLAAAKARGEWIAPARGLWAPVAPEFRAWGGPPATEFITALADHLNVDYYVGWLAAAELHGASHHAPQVSQIAVSRLIRDRRVGRARLSFHVRSNLARLPVMVRMARAGRYRVSSPEVTALDIAADIDLAGGLDNAATVIADLADETGLDETKLSEIAPLFPAAASRRVGWIVENYADVGRLDALALVTQEMSAAPARLHPSLGFTGSLDRRWGLRINKLVEVEQ
jgi:predicted transcriptional regulator of viral defense system